MLRWILRAIGLVGGVASLVGFVYFGWISFRLHFLTKPTQPGRSGSDTSLGQLYDAASAAAHSAGTVLDYMARGVVDGLALACALALALCAGLYWLGQRL